jgi:2-amino-4-hydroxy-6-hydroxymethyldihydropteridine diphosphokinase
MAMMQTTSFIALGANLGDAQGAVRQAMQDIAALPQTQVRKCSQLYRSAPVDSSGPDYINAVVEISTGLTAQGLLQELQQLENKAGRQRPYTNAPRTLDLDILIFGDVAINTPQLTLPHPRMAARAFVLLPLAEIAPARVTAQQLQAVATQVIERMGGYHHSALE